MVSMLIRRLGLLILCLGMIPLAAAQEPEPKFATRAERGQWLLLNKAFLPPDFDQETFDQLWQRWEEPARSAAEKASPDERRKLLYARYGLTERPDDPLHRPMQYVVSKDGQWSMNCLACHQGTLAGQVIPGLANAQYNMQSLYEDVRNTKIPLGKKPTHMDVGSALLPLSTSRGTTNAVMFGVVLLNFRKPDLSLDKARPLPTLTNHDHDAPAWWHYHRKNSIYIDGFAPKGHRPLMQFLLVEQNGPAEFAKWEGDFADVSAWLESLRPPKFPDAIDAKLAEKGQFLFNTTCSKCHGTYGEGGKWPGRMVSLDVVGTDPQRSRGLSVKQREHYATSWFARAGKDRVTTNPTGYVAPPLDGIWASGPYFHNGSVPTLAGVLEPRLRPVVWKHNGDQRDPQLIGVSYESLAEVPATAKTASQKREYYDTRETGKSNSGHDFAKTLDKDQKLALLEYLKTL